MATSKVEEMIDKAKGKRTSVVKKVSQTEC